MAEKSKSIEHAQFGNVNAQETIRFIDTKIGVALAFLGAICGGAYGVWSDSVNAVVAGAQKLDLLSILVSFSVLSLVGFLFFLVRVIHFSCMCLIPRSPSTTNAKVKHSVLFPFIDCRQSADEYRAGIAKLAKGMTEQEILDEFGDQSVVLGQVISAKMHASRAAIQNLKWLVFFMIGMCCFLGAVKGCSRFSEKETPANQATSL